MKTFIGLSMAFFLLSGVALSTLADDASPEWTVPARQARKQNPIAADAASIAAGNTVYVKNCLSCHGATGAGDGTAAKDLNPKPKNLGAPVVVAESDGALFWKISTGKKPMPKFDPLLSDDDRWNVVNYVRTLAPPAPAK